MEKQIFESMLSITVKYGWLNACVPLSITLHELFTRRDIKCKIVTGYIITDNIDAAWHCWVEADGIRYDPAMETLKRFYPNSTSTFSTSKTLPSTCERIDLDTEEELEFLRQNIEGVEKYTKAPTSFWNRDYFIEQTKDPFGVDSVMKLHNKIMKVA